MATESRLRPSAKDLIDRKPSEKSKPRIGREVLVINRQSNICIARSIGEVLAGSRKAIRDCQTIIRSTKQSCGCLVNGGALPVVDSSLFNELAVGELAW